MKSATNALEHSFKSSFIRNALTFLIVVIVGLLLLVAVYLIPTGPMREHIAAELDVMEWEYGVQPFPGRDNAELDTMTGYHMVAIAINESSDNAVIAALSACYKLPAPPIDQLRILQETVNPTEDAASPSYTRYWHGYLVPLKVELLFADYYSILLYNGIALLALVALVVFLMARRDSARFVPAFILSIGLISPVSVSMSLPYYACAYISLISLIIVLLFHDTLERKCLYSTLFMLVGMATSYLDFLTAPIVTLGFPLVLYGLMLTADGRFSWKKLVFLPISWLVGYAGMWAAKWAIGTIVLGQNVFEEAMGQVTTRMSTYVGNSVNAMMDERITYSNVMERCIGRLVGSASAKGLIALYTIASICYFIREAKTGCVSFKGRFGVAILLLIVAAMPFFWSRALENHTWMHAYFTFRMFSISVFGLGCLPFVFMGKKEPHAGGKHFSTEY